MFFLKIIMIYKSILMGNRLKLNINMFKKISFKDINLLQKANLNENLL